MVLAIFIAFLALVALFGECFLPGGVLALLSGLLFLASLLLFFFKASLPLFFLFLVLVLGSGVATFAFALSRIKRSGRRNAFFLQSDQEGYGGELLSKDLLGKDGVVTAELRPSGYVRVENRLYQALSQGVFLAKDTPVRVVNIQGSHIIVQPKT